MGTLYHLNKLNVVEFETSLSQFTNLIILDGRVANHKTKF
jgi:hypothetical protein